MDQAGPVNIYYLLFLGSVGMFILAIASILLVVAYSRRNLRAKEEKYRMEKEHADQLIHSNLKTLEDERTRFARDIHDEIGVNLSAVHMQLKGVKVLDDKQQMVKRLDDISEVLNQAMQSTRRIAHNLIPPGLEKFGLHEILSEQIEAQMKGLPLEIRILSDANIRRTTYENELMLYRIIQELLNNTIKHSEAKEVVISLTNENDHYLLVYNDNGKGFDTTLASGIGLGIRNLESRAALIGAVCEIRSAEGKGMQARVMVPLQSNT